MDTARKTVRRGGLFALGALILGVAGTASAGTFPTSISSTVAQSDNKTSSPLPIPLTGIGNPYDFGSQPFGVMTSIDQIYVTLTLIDGDSGVGELDYNKLTLGLDGIDTGILLNGFRDNKTDTLTIGGAPLNSNALLAALQSDGRLVGTIIDKTPNDQTLYLPKAYNTTLQIQGMAHAPEPGTVTLLAIGIAPVVRALRRRRRTG